MGIMILMFNVVVQVHAVPLGGLPNTRKCLYMVRPIPSLFLNAFELCCHDEEELKSMFLKKEKKR